MVGKVFWFVTVKVSVRHRVVSDTPLPPDEADPPNIKAIVNVLVDGPEMTKVLKSRRI